MDEILRYEKVSISYNGIPRVKDVSFSLKKGQILGIVGESGSGKTTLIRAVMGLLGTGGVVSKGKIIFDNENLSALSANRLRQINGAKIGMVFQHAGAFFCPIRTIGDQLYESVLAHQKQSKKEFFIEAAALLERLGLKDAERMLSSYPMELSGGMQQRVGIASALLLHPALLLADEPTSALDVLLQKKVVEELCLAREELGVSIVIVSHNIGVIRSMADQILVMKDGECVEQGNAQNVLSQPQHPYTAKLLSAIPQIKNNTPVNFHDSKEIQIQVSHLTKQFGTQNGTAIAAVSDVSFSLKKKEALGLVGESGSGKSTIAKLLLGLTKPSAGDIRLNDQSIIGLRGRAKRQLYKELQMVFQTPTESFDPRQTIGAGVGEPLRNGGMRGKTLRAEVAKLLSLCGLPESYYGRYPHQLSGGECQRAAIARAIAVRPQLLVCDEATSSLDMTIQKEIMELFAYLRKELSLSFLFISHDLALVHQFCERVLVMYQGKIVEEGTCESIITNPKETYTKQLCSVIWTQNKH
ncbi:MAG: ABC transporter ATP-binding protein [Lachnospiraceae bacterium]|nr:ABC transporter ATP-binding protein [Lachnospiraceae bacterium]